MAAPSPRARGASPLPLLTSGSTPRPTTRNAPARRPTRALDLVSDLGGERAAVFVPRRISPGAAGARPSSTVGESDPRIESMPSTPVGWPSTRASRTVPAASSRDRPIRAQAGDEPVGIPRLGPAPDHGVPVVPVEPGRVEQTISARRDRERGGDRGDADDGGEQRRAHGHRGAAATGLQRHANTGHAARRESRPREESRRPPRSRPTHAPRGAALPARQGRAPRAARGPPSPRRLPRPPPDRGRVPGSGSAVRATPIGASGERTTARPAASAPAAEADRGDAHQAEDEELAARHSERSQERCSVDSSAIWRASACPTRSSAARPPSAARAHSACA